VSLRTFPVSALVCGAATLAASACAAQREIVEFTLDHVVPSDQWSLYVLGDVPELGGGDIRNALEMYESSPGQWTISVEIPKNTAYTYEFWQRRHTLVRIRDETHGVLVSGPLAGQTSAGTEPAVKRAWYMTALADPVLHWRTDDGAYQVAALIDGGAGRSGAERRCFAYGFGLANRPVEFYLSNSAGDQTDPPSGTYVTPLDAFCLQDGALYSYIPAPSVSAARRDYDALSPPTLLFAHTGELRSYRVMLPRGYDEHVDRRYPVFYWHDGGFMWEEANPISPLLFDPNGAMSAALTDGGMIGECIQVAIDNYGTDNCTAGNNRVRDYIPPIDTADWCIGGIQGEADHYVDFLVNDLKPLIDATYRTLPDRENTFTGGASYAAVCALYMGWDYADTFGGIAAYSISRHAENFLAYVQGGALPDTKIYVDSGDDNWVSARDYRLALTNRPGTAATIAGDVWYHYAPFAVHEFDDFGLRWPVTARYLLPAEREAPAVPVPGDVNGDLRVDLADLALVLSDFGASGAFPGDLDGDGDVDLEDLSRVLSYYGIDAS